MKRILWDSEKAKVLRNNKTRGCMGFEECVVAIEGNGILDVVRNPSVNHPDQNMYILNIENYAYCVPFVESEDVVFLKTMFPSRKFTAIYLGNKKL